MLVAEVNTKYGPAKLIARFATVDGETVRVSEVDNAHSGTFFESSYDTMKGAILDCRWLSKNIAYLESQIEMVRKQKLGDLA